MNDMNNIKPNGNNDKESSIKPDSNNDKESSIKPDGNNDKKTYITPCCNYDEKTVRSAMEANLVKTGLLDFVHPGMKIAIKLNLIATADPEKAVTTNPALVMELCRLLIERGASVTAGDSPGGLWTSAYVKSIYKNSGFMCIEETGAKLNNDFSVKNAFYGDAVSLKNFSYTGWIDDADAIIDFCKLKTHGMLGMTCAVKNMFGVIPGTMKPECHMRFPDKKAFANIMIDLNEYFKPVLYICDAVDAMEGNGPTAGSPHHIGALLSCRSPYELDMVCAHLIGLGKKDVQTLEEAYERGLGPSAVEDVEIEGSAEPFVQTDFKMATVDKSILFEGKGPIAGIESFFIKRIFGTKPVVNVNKCIGCAKCAGICPAHAITMKDGKPVIERNRCIHCFCCQEFCPKGAMTVHRTIVARILEK